MKITEKVVDISTGKEQIFERDMTPQEIADYEANQLRAQQRAQAEAEAAAKKAVAEAKLAALGLTADDLKALGLGGN